jgi:hypothetical protein
MDVLAILFSSVIRHAGFKTQIMGIPFIRLHIKIMHRNLWPESCREVMLTGANFSIPVHHKVVMQVAITCKAMELKYIIPVLYRVFF